MPVIDLGDVSDPSADPGEYPRFRRREFDRTALRRLVSAVLAGVCVLALGGSALPAPSLLREMWSIPFSDSDTMAVHGDFVYVFRTLADGPHLVAHDLTTGAVRWTRPTGERPSSLQAVPQAGGVLLLAGEEEWVEPQPGDEEVSPHVYGGSITAFDPATGAVLWKHPGMEVYGGTGETVLSYERGRDGVITTLRLLNSRDGSVVWERRPPAGTDSVEVLRLDGKASRIVTAGLNGEVTVLRYSDGTQVTSARVPWTPRSPDSGTGSTVTTATGLVLVLDLTEGPSTMIAYRADTLAPLWTRKFTDWGTVHECGPVICVGDGGSFTGVEPETGEPRWVADGSPSSWMTLDGGLLLVSGNDDAPSQRIIDAATGRATGLTGRGEVLYRDDEGGLILARNLFPDTTRMAVSRLDLDTGRAVLIGTIPVGDQRICGGEGRHIVCHADGRLTVTAVG